MDISKLKEGSPLLLGAGKILAVDAARALGLSKEELLGEVLNSRCELLCLVDGWTGYAVSIEQVEKDFDGGYILNSAYEAAVESPVQGFAYVSSVSLAVKHFLASGEYLDSLMFQDRDRKHAIFFQLPEKSVPFGAIYVLKEDMERLRVRLAKGISPSLAAATVARITPSEVAALPAPAHKNATKPASELVAAFVKARRKNWKPDQQKRLERSYGFFISLMGDPQIGSINRELLRSYEEKLKTIPANLHRVQKSTGLSNLNELIARGKTDSLDTLSSSQVDFNLEKISELLNWAAEEQWIASSPAKGLVKPTKRVTPVRDDREQFEPPDLEVIFSSQWFKTGKGQKTKEGSYYQFQPFYYWLPLIAAFSGARLNELAQLYIDDLKQTAAGNWYFDFNLDGDDKLAADDKSLKNVNSIRKVPVAQALIDLGLIDYVQMLKKHGHKRVFPELRFDKIKGYGKQAGQWFNERFLGNQLKITRSIGKTFHSFRHTLISGLFAAEHNEQKINQISGHSRGDSMSGNRYRKDVNPDDLKSVIDSLSLSLPSIAKFDLAEGMNALNDALQRKQNFARNRGSKALASRANLSRSQDPNCH